MQDPPSISYTARKALKSLLTIVARNLSCTVSNIFHGIFIRNQVRNIMSLGYEDL